MENMMKKHWPILFAIAAVIFSVILAVAATNSTDTGVAIFFGVAIFMFLFPLTGAVMGGWYGWTIRSPLKWLLAPAAYLAIILYLVVEDLILSSGSVDITSYLSVGLFTGVACLAVEAVTSVIAWLARKNKDSQKGTNERE